MCGSVGKEKVSNKELPTFVFQFLCYRSACNAVENFKTLNECKCGWQKPKNHELHSTLIMVPASRQCLKSMRNHAAYENA